VPHVILDCPFSLSKVSTGNTFKKSYYSATLS
jgi:hypothetical protein